MTVVGAALPVAAVFSLLTAWFYRRWSYRRYFKTIFLPEASKRGVSLVDAYRFLVRINPRDRSLDEGSRHLARACPILKEMLEASGLHEELRDNELVPEETRG